MDATFKVQIADKGEWHDRIVTAAEYRFYNSAKARYANAVADAVRRGDAGAVEVAQKAAREADVPLPGIPA